MSLGKYIWFICSFLCLCLKPRWITGGIIIFRCLVFPLICFFYYRSLLLTASDINLLCSSVCMCGVSICRLCASGLQLREHLVQTLPTAQLTLSPSSRSNSQSHPPPLNTSLQLIGSPPVSMCEQRNNSTAVLQWNMKPSLVPLCL